MTSHHDIAEVVPFRPTEVISCDNYDFFITAAIITLVSSFAIIDDYQSHHDQR